MKANSSLSIGRLALEGGLTFETVPSLHQRLLHSVQEIASPSLIVDLSQVTHCDSAGLAFLIHAGRLCWQEQKPLSVTGVPDSVRALATFCGVEQIFTELT
jgi:phospholipid transport system transporter-binding protein